MKARIQKDLAARGHGRFKKTNMDPRTRFGRLAMCCRSFMAQTLLCLNIGKKSLTMDDCPLEREQAYPEKDRISYTRTSPAGSKHLLRGLKSMIGSGMYKYQK
jgi:hypothetical protein